jgi:hypothetical protein
MYSLLKYQVATSGFLHIVAQYYTDIMPLRPSKIQTRFDFLGLVTIQWQKHELQMLEQH